MGAARCQPSIFKSLKRSQTLSKTSFAIFEGKLPMEKVTTIINLPIGVVTMHETISGNVYCKIPSGSSLLEWYTLIVMLNYGYVTDRKSVVKSEDLFYNFMTINQRASYLLDKISGELRILGDEGEIMTAKLIYHAEYLRLKPFITNLDPHNFQNWKLNGKQG